MLKRSGYVHVRQYTAALRPKGHALQRGWGCYKDYLGWVINRYLRPIAQVTPPQAANCYGAGVVSELNLLLVDKELYSTDRVGFEHDCFIGPNKELPGTTTVRSVRSRCSCRGFRVEMDRPSTANDWSTPGVPLPLTPHSSPSTLYVPAVFMHSIV